MSHPKRRSFLVIGLSVMLLTTAAGSDDGASLIRNGDYVVILDYPDQPVRNGHWLPITSRGTIAWPVIGEIEVVGLTVEQLDQLLERSGRRGHRDVGALLVGVLRKTGERPREFIEYQLLRPGRKPMRFLQPISPGFQDPGAGCAACG